MNHEHRAIRYLVRGGGWWTRKRAQYACARIVGFGPLSAFWVTFGP